MFVNLIMIVNNAILVKVPIILNNPFTLYFIIKYIHGGKSYGIWT